MRGLYRVADALLFPSRAEGFGIPPLEAAVVGIPAFIAETPALDELPLESAVRFEPGIDPGELAGRILARLRAGEPLRADRRRVWSAYRWERIYENSIRPLLERPDTD